MTLFHKYSKIKILFILLSVSIFASTFLLAKLNFRFYYFNPDSVQSNFSSLKQGIDTFFQQHAIDSSFQAFSQKVDFDHMVKADKPALVFVPSWYYRLYGEKLNLQPILSSLNHGKPEYTKILLIRKDDQYTLSDIAAKTVAMTTMGPDTEKTFGNMYGQLHGVNLSKSNIIITPKDGDALYALVLGQVDAALVGRDTLETMGQSNSRVLKMVKELATSAPMPMPLLCTVGTQLSKSEITTIKGLFLDEGRESPPPTFMQMLRFDGWKEIHN